MLTRSMLFDEAFALHFLEDVFASGHVAGTWGDTSQRKGTHDFYNEAGLEVFPWKGSSESMVLMGDAHMRPEDKERAAAAVRTSLEQLLDAAAGRSRAANLPYTPAAPLRPTLSTYARTIISFRARAAVGEIEAYWGAYATDLSEVLRPTPVPGLGPGLGAMPRYRSEVGGFIGLSSAIGGRWVNGGFTSSSGTGFIGEVEVAGRVGLGLDGVMGDSGDGLVFFQLGLIGDSASTNQVAETTAAEAGGALTAAIPARTGVSMRLRMPFYLIPGDLALPVPDVPHFAPDIPGHGSRRIERRFDSVAVGPGDRHRSLSIRARPGTGRHLLRAQRQRSRARTQRFSGRSRRRSSRISRSCSICQSSNTVPTGRLPATRARLCCSSSSPLGTFRIRRASSRRRALRCPVSTPSSRLDCG